MRTTNMNGSSESNNPHLQAVMEEGVRFGNDNSIRMRNPLRISGRRGGCHMARQRSTGLQRNKPAHVHPVTVVNLRMAVPIGGIGKLEQ